MPKAVLVTGGCGFIGRHLCGELLQHGYKLRVLDSFIDQVHGAHAQANLPDVEILRGDVRDEALVKTGLAGIDAVVHLAAEVGVGQSMYEIARYVGANDLGAAVLLQAMIDAPVERIVVASSMSVYGEGLYRSATGATVNAARRTPQHIAARQWDPRDADGALLVPAATPEDKPVDLASIYALTKYAQERATLIFGAAYKIDAVALRLFNVFGPGQALSNPYTGVLANFATRIVNGQRPLVFEDGAQRRDFVHVMDVARAFRLALERDSLAGETINIGSGRSYSIAEVAHVLAGSLGRDLTPDILGKARSGDIRHCFADISKARRLLNFEPQQTLEEAVPELAEWVHRNEAKDRAPQMARELEERGLVA